ncbi:MAG TPA: pyruvate kinase [Patescibacteria group bacterium]|nr:pyruvate kinase [Patescibacteria group bacterium]
MDSLSNFRKTKIVCTIGPASWDYQTMKKMAKEGMDVVRLNMSHGNQEEKAKQIGYARQISDELKKPIAVFADLQGPKLRLGTIDGIRQISSGEILKISTEPKDETELPIQFDLTPFIKPGERMFLNDGLIAVKITGISGKTITVKALNNGVISSNKGVNVPDTNLKDASFTAKDRSDAIFALKEGVDYIALSFVQTAKDIEPVLKLIADHNPKVKIIVKIEKKKAIDNLEEIMKLSSVIMVARGDLAIETETAQVPIYQERIINLCRQYQKPVIVATQMLESMTENPRPTRAEVSDVANAVLDQVDAVMLSAESASGKYPVEAVATMKDIINSVESHPDYHHAINIHWEKLTKQEMSLMAIAASATSLALRVGAKAIVTGTATGKTAKITSAFRPNTKIIAVTHDGQTRNQLSLVWGVEPAVVKPSANFNIFMDHILSEIARGHGLKKNDKVVVVTGTTAGVSGTTNTIKVATV